ncbi:uncharacterized protein ATC70_003204 [Mucor velutinosus]|uniref:Ubiquitin-like domain-containing protein n=1 Tax=Mucor velutinosus TaxID=708070 RepID=A0AAN7D966_9FUNG|nr:hypothetical protein ATC70_003204 [Mucor velutinosus]
MSDFDIAKTQTGPSFLESLKRRKAFGLAESDDEDSIPTKAAKEKHPKKKKKKSPEPISEDEQETTKRPSSRTASRSPSPSTTTQSNVNPYLASVIDLDNISFTPQPKPTTPASQQSTQNTQSSVNVIDLSDEDQDGDDVGVDDLDPDLAALAHSIVPGSSTQPEKIVIKIQYTHNYDLSNLAESTVKGIKFFEKPIKFKVMDNTQFRVLLTSFCATKKYLNVDDVYLTYNDDIVFLSGTPASVGMTSMGTHKMEIYPKGCYDKMMADKEEQRQKERMRHLNGIENEDDMYSEKDSIANAASFSETPANDEPEEERVRLSLRTGDNKKMPFRVKATTTLRELVNAFRERAGISENVQLSFEGEIMDLSQTIEETDLEDEDIVEVITQ